MSKRDAYVEKAKAKLDQWNAEIDRIQAKKDAAEADARIEYEQQLQDLRAKRDEARAKLKEMAEASDDAWDDIRKGFERAWDDISDSLERAFSRFK